MGPFKGSQLSRKDPPKGNMMKIFAVLLSLFLVGAETCDDQVFDLLEVVFCACDEDYNGSLTHEELTTDVCKNILDHEVSAEDFASADTNGDGEITYEEATVWANSNARIYNRAMEMTSPKMFSGNAQVEAMVRVLGCVCDSNGNYALDFEELTTPVCSEVQNWMFGGTIDQDNFDAVDTNNDGEITGDEAAEALEDGFNDNDDDDDDDESGDPDTMDLINVVFCACDEDGSDTLSQEEVTTELCQVILDHELSQDDFASIDENGDGEATKEEVVDWALSNGHMDERATSMKSPRMFSDNVHIKAMVRILGCVCDNDGNMALSFEEFNSEVCIDVQKWLFGETLDEKGFETVDQDQNGEIDGFEAADALEYWFNNKA